MEVCQGNDGYINRRKEQGMNVLRRENMKEYIRKKGIVSLKELTALFPDVSVMTLHRDLNYLAEEGDIARIRGGAKYVGENHEEISDISNKSEKDIVAKKAVDFVKEGSAIYLDCGTTMMELAKILPDMYINVVTCGANVAMEAAKQIHPTINLCGGVLNRNNLSTTGSFAEIILSQINIDVAFVSAAGYSLEGGFTCGFETQASFRRLLIEKARCVIILMDSSKIGRMLPFTFADMQDIDYLITDKKPSPELLELAQKNNVIVM